MGKRKKILFISEDITLAQVVRLKVLADALNDLPLDIYFACSDFPEMIFAGSKFKQYTLKNIGKDAAKMAVLNCTRLYNEKVAEAYVQEDIALINTIRPDLIISDFRLSLCVSAAVTKTPFACLANAYWSPYRASHSFPMPDHPWEAKLNLQVMQKFYPVALPFVFQHFVQPFNVLRKKYKLKPVDGLPELITYGDYTLYADIEGMHEMKNLPSNHYFIGSIQWSPAVPVSPEIKKAMCEPYIYVTMGSSGRSDKMQELTKVLEELPVRSVVATAGTRVCGTFKKISFSEYLPGSLMAKHALMVVSNGGSTTGYQALFEGKPVLGIASNLDQYLCMENLVRLGVGKIVRAGSFKREDFRQCAETILSDDIYSRSAKAISKEFKNQCAKENFKSFLHSTGIL